MSGLSALFLSSFFFYRPNFHTVCFSKVGFTLLKLYRRCLQARNASTIGAQLAKTILCRSSSQYCGDIFVAKGGVVACLLKFSNFRPRHPCENPQGLTFSDFASFISDVNVRRIHNNFTNLPEAARSANRDLTDDRQVLRFWAIGEVVSQDD